MTSTGGVPAVRSNRPTGAPHLPDPTPSPDPAEPALSDPAALSDPVMLPDASALANPSALPNPSALIVCVLALSSGIAPFATDMYLSALPRMAAGFGVSTTSIQLTLTGFLLGLALGQLVIGPLSDGIGRRPPLLIGSAVCIAASVACALAPSADLLIITRFVQGFAGGAAAVLSRAVIADRTRGAATARYFSMMMVIGGAAPIIAPIAGAALVDPIGWRGIFWVITGITVVIFLGLLACVPESLPRARRSSGGLRGFAATARVVLSNRRFVCYTATFSLGFMTLFGWISASSFVLQNELGLSTGWYSVAFASNSVALLGASALNARIVGRFGPERMMRIGLTSLVTVTLLFGLNVALGTHLWPTLVLAFLTLGCMGLVLGNGAALAIGQVRHAAGTGSALLGASQFGLGALVAPLVGLAGNRSAVPVAISMIVTAALAAGAFALAGGRPGRPAVLLTA